MKIVYVTETMPFGHGEAFFIPEVKGLLALGHDVRIVPVNGGGSITHEDARDLLERTMAAPLLSRTVVREALLQSVQSPGRAIAALGDVIARSRNLTVMAKNLLAYPKGLWLARRLKACGTEHIHACWTTFPGTIAMVASRVSGIPWSMSAHSGEILDDWLLKHKLHSASFTRFIAHSWLQVAVRAQGISFPQNKLLVVHMGVDLPQAIYPVKESARVLLCPATFIPLKGHQFLFESLAQLIAGGIEAEVWCAGDGPGRREMEVLAQELNIADRVRFLGMLSHDELLGLYETGDIAAVVLPTLREGIPVSLIEAMAYGIPVVSTTAGGIPELLWGEAGLMVPPMNSAALTSAIQRVLQEPDLRKKLGMQGRRRVEEAFAASKVVRRLSDAFQIAK